MYMILKGILSKNTRAEGMQEYQIARENSFQESQIWKHKVVSLKWL